MSTDPGFWLTFSLPHLQTSDKGEDDRLYYGVSAMQGWRISMEDSHTTVLDLVPASDSSKPNPDKLSFFGVFDGHGGDKVALFAGENIHNIIAKQDSFKAGDYAQGLKDGFLATDRAILTGMRRPRTHNIPTNSELCSALLFCQRNLRWLTELLVIQTPSTRKRSQAAPRVSG